MAEVENLIDGPLAQALEAGRPRFNALFAQARRHTPMLDPAAFAGFLRSHLAPVIAAVAPLAPDRLGEVVDVLYEFALELVGKDFGVRYPAVLQGWDRLLRTLPRHLAGAPRRFAGSVTNALYNLSVTPGARPLEWLDVMTHLGTRCDDVDALLAAGTVAAWRAGLAHFRDGALEACRKLDPVVACLALGRRDALNRIALAVVLNRLRDDPWLSVAEAGADNGDKKMLRIVARVGGFRGFGGSFLTPPTVAGADGHIHIADAESCWLLCADRYGATLHRSANGLPQPDGKPPFQVLANGTVRCGDASARFDELQACTSFAATATTLAVTVPLAHIVYLVALVPVAA
jgi:hypothetical protein